MALARRARTAPMSARKRRRVARQFASPRRLAARRQSPSSTVVVAACPRPQQLHGMGAYTRPESCMASTWAA
eukprot:6324677-Heterocapsa_arctica.AAC.1